jgi:hypothetical protein
MLTRVAAHETQRLAVMPPTAESSPKFSLTRGFTPLTPTLTSIE